MKPAPKPSFDAREMRNLRFDLTELGRDALQEDILAEQRRADLRVLSESSEPLSYGVRCWRCGQYVTACICSTEASQ